ncbi:hypothetical protein SLE2022_165380 [Rubroshorea leprosula]
MDISPIGDTRAVATAQDLGFAKFHLHRPHSFTCNNHLALCSDPSAETSEFLPIYAFAPPTVKSNRKTSRRTILSRKRRTRRRTTSSGDSDEGGDYGFFGGDGYGSFGSGSGGGGWGGNGWNFDRFGGHDWDESSSSWSSPAFSFIYEVVCWIALSNCVHFAFKKMARAVAAAGIGDAEREKVPIRLASIC